MAPVGGDRGAGSPRDAGSFPRQAQIRNDQGARPRSNQKGGLDADGPEALRKPTSALTALGRTSSEPMGR
eukprot:486323-Pyramimonas_sp.AAC.1